MAKSRTADFARCSSKLSDRRPFFFFSSTSQRLMSHALFPGNCASSQIDLTRARREARVNYFFIAISVTKFLRNSILLRIHAIGKQRTSK